MKVHRYGIFRFRMSTISAPTTPSSTAHRLRPSMLNLDAISRNLFGTGSVSSRSQANTTEGSEIFGTTSTKKSKSGLSRSSTLETDSRLSIETAKTASMEAEKDKPRAFGFPSDDPSQRELIAGTPYGAVGRLGMGQSEVDLNERLNLARKNSKSMAMLSPKPSGARKLGSKSVAELRSQVEIRQTTEQAEEALREACEP